MRIRNVMGAFAVVGVAACATPPAPPPAVEVPPAPQPRQVLNRMPVEMSLVAKDGSLLKCAVMGRDETLSVLDKQDGTIISVASKGANLVFTVAKSDGYFSGAKIAGEKDPVVLKEDSSRVDSDQASILADVAKQAQLLCVSMRYSFVHNQKLGTHAFPVASKEIKTSFTQGQLDENRRRVDGMFAVVRTGIELRLMSLSSASETVPDDLKPTKSEAVIVVNPNTNLKPTGAQ